jgi:N-formylglutamate amidohydrolase
VTIFSWHAGETPLIISFPHSGTDLPPEIEARLTPAARALPDTDWHVPRLYDFARDLGVSWLEAHLSRYVADLNRPPDDRSLYPGQATTGLCPVETFAGEALYADGDAPADAEVAERVAHYWRPYHDRLRTALEETVGRHGVAILLDAHSIASRVPRLFEGRLPDLNLGTAHGQSCAPALRNAAADALRDAGFSRVVDGRFVGGYITRHYGAPERGVHALQLEIAQGAYLQEDGDGTFEAARATALRSVLRRLVRRLLREANNLTGC